jgi:hypothetical protein
MKSLTTLLLMLMYSTCYSNMDSSLVLYLPFDNSNNDLTLYSNPCILATNFSYVEGLNKQGIKFKGIDSPGQLLIQNSFIDFKTDSITISAWVRLDNPNGMHGGVEMRHCILSIERGDYFHVWIDYTNDLLSVVFQNYYGQPNTTDAAFVGSTEYKIGTWIFITLVFDKQNTLMSDIKEQRVYFNGELNSVSQLKTLNFKYPLTGINIGRMGDHWYPMNGAIDELKIYKRALTADEIKQEFNITSIDFLPNKNNDIIVEQKANTLYVTNNSQHNETLRIINCIGKLLTTYSINEGTNIVHLDNSNLTNGIYFCSIHNTFGKIYIYK